VKRSLYGLETALVCRIPRSGLVQLYLRFILQSVSESLLDDVVLGGRADSRCSDYEDKHAIKGPRYKRPQAEPHTL
jgi:hypothetical protein